MTKLPNDFKQADNDAEENQNCKKGSIFQIPLAGIQKLGHLAELIPQELSPRHRTILLIILGAGIFSLGFGALQAFAKNSAEVFWSFIAGLAFFGIVLLYFLGKREIAQDEIQAINRKRITEKGEKLRAKIIEQEQIAEEELSHKGFIAWTRDVPRLPLSDDEKRRDIICDLENIRNGAFYWLNEKHPELKGQQVRANIFLPKYEEAGKGVVCMLRMPEFFRLGMHGHTDEEIAFRPGEGATGKAFVDHQSDVVIFDVKEKKWDDRFLLSEYQKRRIHSGLSWILTYPLKNEKGESMAILNIDCIGFPVHEHELHHLKGDLQEKVDEITDKLNNYYSKVRISINVETLNG